MLIKGKVASIMLAGALVTGGAVAGASSESFTDFLNRTTDAVFTKVANYAGYNVYKHGVTKKAEVQNAVTNKANSMAGQVGGHLNTEIGRGTSEVNTHASGLITEINDAMEAEKLDANGRITSAVNDEVGLTKSEMEQVAKDTAQALINQLDSQVPTPNDGRGSN